MKIWKFSASGLLRGAVAAALAGAVVLGLGLPAQASLLTDNIIVTTNFDNADPGTTCTPCVDGDGTTGITVDGSVELFTGDGSGFGNFFTGAAIPGNMLNIFAPTASIDIQESSIIISFGLPDTGMFDGSSTGFNGNFVFSSLDWTDFPDGEIADVTGVVSEGVLSMPLLINDIFAHSFRVALDCETPILPPFTGVCAVDSGTGMLTIVLTIETTGHDGNGNGEPVPEPSTLWLFGVGLAGLALVRRRRRTLWADRAKGHHSLQRAA